MYDKIFISTCINNYYEHQLQIKSYIGSDDPEYNGSYIINFANNMHFEFTNTVNSNSYELLQYI